MVQYLTLLLVQSVIHNTVSQNTDTEDVPTDRLKLPSQITISGRMSCSKTPAYAVLISIVEKVSYLSSGNKLTSGDLRISRYSLTDREGRFTLKGSRYVATDPLSLNITHHCVPLAKRKKYRNCFTKTRYTVRGDPKNVQYEVDDIALDQLSFQGEVECRDWPYEYPKFVQDYIAKHPT